MPAALFALTLRFECPAFVFARTSISTQERKRKKAAAVKRHLKRLSRENMRGTGGGAPASAPAPAPARPY